MKNTVRAKGKKYLKITAFLDGRPGHEKQTKSILTALARRTPMDITFRDVRTGAYFEGLKNWAWYVGFRVFLRKRNKNGASLDCVVGTGAYTHIPMIRLANGAGAKTVTCMSPSYPLVGDFDLCLVPRHDKHPVRDNILVTLGPPICSRPGGGGDDNRGLILIGGLDRRSHRWHSDSVIAQIRFLLENQKAVAWTVSSSPRTPEETMAGIDGLAKEAGNLQVYRASRTPAGWIEKQYEENQVVWVTADSVSMIFEALAAGCRVGVFPVEWKRTGGKFKRCIDHLIENRWVTPFDKRRALSTRMVEGKPLNEANRCAEEILKRWWPDRLR